MTSPHDAPLPYARGDRLAGRYVVEELLGRGGMGVVLRAFDEKLQRAVALKVLPSSALLDGTARARMLREARSAAALDHPGIVHVYDVGETGDGGSFIAMELVRGRSLRAAALAGALDHATLGRLIGDVAATLASAHRAGLVHRDVKPDNVMLRDDGRIVVLDFGLAKPMEHAPGAMALTDDGSIVGTPAYLSPEQARGATLGPASDQFALAVTAFELLTGRLPWSGSNAMSVLASIIADEPASAAALVPGLPPSVDVVLRRALAKSAADRYPDCDAFGRALADALRESTTSARAADAATLSLLDTMAAPTPASMPRAIPASTPATTTREPPTAPPGPARSRAPIAIVGTLVVALGGLAAWLGIAQRAHESAAPAPSSSAPLVLGSDSVLACPILEVERAGAEQGWLGAAVASAICDRAGWMLGGRTDRTRIPAELLELPATPTEGAVEDVFCAADARDRSIAEARRIGTASVEGTIERTTSRGLHVRVHLRGADGRDRDPVEATGTLEEVARAITDAWTESGALPRAMAIDPELARWTLVSDGALALAIYDVSVSDWTMEPADAACAAILAHAHELDPLALAAIAGCDGLAVAPVDDVSSAPRLALTATFSPRPRPDLIAPLEAAREAERSDLGRAFLAAAEARTLRPTDQDRAVETMLVAARTRGAGFRMWAEIGYWASGSALGPSVTRSATEWAPTDPDTWGNRALGFAPGDPMRLELLRRAHAVAPRNTSVAADLAFALLSIASFGEALGVAAEIADAGPDQRFVADMITTIARSAQGRIGSAQGEAARLIERLEHVAYYRRQDFYLASWVIELVVLTGDRTLADAYLARALAESSEGSDPIDDLEAHDQFVALLAAVATPARASEALAHVETHDALVDGVRALLGHDEAEALRLLRPVLAASDHAMLWPTVAALGPVLEDGGAGDIVSRADARLGTTRGLFGGIGTVDVRIARRHASPSERDASRAAAQRVVDALASSDLRLPLEDEMRRLAATP